MSELLRALRDVQSGSVARLLLADILHLAEREGILDRIRRLSPFSDAGLCETLQADLGYGLEKGNRRRMIHLLLRLLRECGRVRELHGMWVWRVDDPMPVPRDTGGTGPAPERQSAEGQYLFFRHCLESVPAYLRGGDPSVVFDETNAAVWESFLGCVEFRTCRSLLLELMGIDDHSRFRLLDLCYGPGWGLEAAISQFPTIRVTALDFTEVFHGRARTRVECAQARHRDAGHPVVPITWMGPDRWRGFGSALPFSDNSFEAVLFTCGDPYIPHHLRGEVYREIRRILTPEGKLGMLTRCHAEADAGYVPSFWLRVSALAHDFAESVCAGWEGFSGAEENMQALSHAGFRGGVAGLGTMSALESSLWVLRKCRGHD